MSDETGGFLTSYSYFDHVKAFHRLFEEVPENPRLLTSDEWTLRVKLILEEFSETADAQAFDDLAGFADGLADLVYVVLGTAVQAGLPFDEVWKEVHTANMQKSGSGIDASGKVLKPPDWKAPDIQGILRRKFNNETAGEEG